MQQNRQLLKHIISHNLAGELEDHATRDILIQILNDEDRHLDEIEELKDQIEHMSLPIFLTTQVG